MKLLGPRLKTKHNGRIMWPTDEGELSMPEISARSGIPEQTLRTRISSYGYDDARVFQKGHLPHPGCVPQTLKKKRDFRPNCRRNWVLCKHYHDCQSSRLGMRHAPQWVEPDTTEGCFEPESTAGRILYTSSLSGVCGIHI